MQRSSQETPAFEEAPASDTSPASAGPPQAAAPPAHDEEVAATQTVPDRDGSPGPRASWRQRGWLLAPVLLLIGFGLLLWQVKAHGPVTRLDLRLRNDIQGGAHDPSFSWMFRPARGMADLGDQTVALSALFLTTAVALRVTRTWLPAIVAGIALAALATVIPLKLLIDRPGPGGNALGDAALGFFPSGHTADAVICYGTSALLLWLFVIPHTPPRFHRLLRQSSIAAAAVLVLLTIFGLLWSNFHWLSDTIGSLCWCGAALIVLYRFTHARAAPYRRGRVIHPPRD
jgi:undecaprenyl-diphosphatase